MQSLLAEAFRLHLLSGLEDELRLAMSHAGLRTPITSLRHYGGVLPRTSEIVETALQVESARGAVA